MLSVPVRHQGESCEDRDGSHKRLNTPSQRKWLRYHFAIRLNGSIVSNRYL